MTHGSSGLNDSAAQAQARLRGVVFDLDDTLTRAGDKTEMWRRMFEHIHAVLPDVDEREEVLSRLLEPTTRAWGRGWGASALPTEVQVPHPPRAPSPHRPG